MCQSVYMCLSKLRTRDNRVAEVAWRDDRLYFAWSSTDGTDDSCSLHAVEVALIEDAPEQGTQVFESAAAGCLYILCGDRTFFSRTAGDDWEEM